MEIGKKKINKTASSIRTKGPKQQKPIQLKSKCCKDESRLSYRNSTTTSLALYIRMAAKLRLKLKKVPPKVPECKVSMTQDRGMNEPPTCFI